jgi:hypothetical protein
MQRSRTTPNRQHSYSISSPSDSFVTNQAIRGIHTITPFFHQVRLKSDVLGYQELQEHYPGLIKQPNNSTNLSHSRTGQLYDKVGWLRLPKTRKRVTINYNPSNSYLPKLLISTASPTVAELFELDLFFSLGSHSLVEFSSIEYTIDFYCRDSTSVGNLFYVLRRNYYCPYSKSTAMRGGEFEGYSHKQNYSLDRKENAVFFVNFASTPTRVRKRIKIYERGCDSTKRSQGKGWNHNDCDRVRFEATIKRPILAKHSIKHVRDLFLTPNFTKMLFPSVTNGRNLFQFRQFKERNYRAYQPPAFYQDYFHRDADSTNFECFIQEILYAKRQKLDLSNSIMNYDPLDTLVNRVKKPVQKFEKHWIKKSADVLNSYEI